MPGDRCPIPAAEPALTTTLSRPPSTDQQLSTIANLNGCLYSGPTQITLSGDQMTVVSPDTPEETVNGLGYQFDTNNNANGSGVPINTNNCPNNGTAPLPANGVIYVETASTAQKWANPFDDPIDNSVTNVSESNLTKPGTTPTSGQSVKLTATVTSDSSSLDTGGTVSFSQSTENGFGQTSTAPITNCTTQTLSTPPTAVTPATSPPSYYSTATCTFTYGSTNTGAFSATFSGGTDASGSSANLGPNYTLAPSTSYGSDSQVTAGGCNSCYYGETSSPDAEGDAFVNGSLSGQLTIGTANNVIVDGNITYADCQVDAGRAARVPRPKDSAPTTPGGNQRHPWA